MSNETFASDRVAELPAILNDAQGIAWAKGMGDVQDEQMSVLRIAALSRLPLLAPDDALDALGQWLLLPRYSGEVDGTTTSGYRGRLCAAWPTWLKAGSAQSVIDSLNGYGIPDVEIFADYQGTFAPGAWFSRFWVILGPDFGDTGIAPLTMPFVLGDPLATLGSTATTDQIKAIKKQVLKFKAAHGYPCRIFFRFEGTAMLGVDLAMPFILGGGSMSASYLIGPLFGIDTVIPFQVGGYVV